MPDNIIKYNKIFYKSCYYILYVKIFARTISAQRKRWIKPQSLFFKINEVDFNEEGHFLVIKIRVSKTFIRIKLIATNFSLLVM